MSGMNDSLDQHPPSGSRKITPTRPLYNDYQSAFANITPNRRSTQCQKIEAMEGIDLDDVNPRDFSSTCPPRIDLGQGSKNKRQPSIRKRAVDVLARAFSNRQASAGLSRRATGVYDEENAQEHSQEHAQEYDEESDGHYYGAYDADYDEDYNENYNKEESGIGSEHPDLDHLRTIQTTDRRSDPFDLETTYSNVLSRAIPTPPPMPQLQTMNEMISQFRKDSESSDEETPAETRPLPSRAVVQNTQRNTGNAPGGSLPSLPRPRRNRNYFAPGVATTSELTSDSYGETGNLLAMGQQSSQKRMSGMSRTSRLSVEDVVNLQSPLKRLTLYGRQVFAAGGEMDLSVGDVRQKPKLNEREVSHALHQQVSNSGPSHSTGTGNHEGRVWFTQTSTSDSNELLNYLDGHQEEVEGSQPAEGFYNQQRIDATWVDAQDTNAIRVPIIYRPLSDVISSHVETELQHEEDQGIQPYENEWETVADTVSMRNNNPFTNRNCRQAGSSVANTSDAGQDLDYVPQQATRLPSHEAVVQHPAINTYPHRYANRQIPGSERDMRIPQYMGHRVGTNNSLRTNPFSSPPPERLSVGPQASRGPIMDFGRDPLTNSSATNGLTMSTEVATDSSVPNGLTSRNFITSSRILTGYDPGSNEGMWTEQQHMEQPQRLSIPPPIPMRSPLRGDHYVGSQNSLNTVSSMNSWDFVNDAANNGDEETIPMVPLASPRPAYLGSNRRSQQNRQSELRRPPGAFYEHIRAAQPSHRSPKRHSSRPYEQLPNSGSSSTMNSTKPGSNFHPKTQKPWPRIRSMPGPDGHHPSRSINNRLATNQSINMGEFQFKDPTWEKQYTTQQMQRIRANHKRREQQQRSVNANIPVSPPQLYSARRRQFISDPAVRSQQSKLSYIALICCIGLPGIGWLLFWYGTLDKFICSMTDGEIERFGKKQKRIALYLACLTGLITIGVLVYLIFAVVNHSLY